MLKLSSIIVGVSQVVDDPAEPGTCRGFAVSVGRAFLELNDLVKHIGVESASFRLAHSHVQNGADFLLTILASSGIEETVYRIESADLFDFH